jgi:hypothetical protein
VRTMHSNNMILTWGQGRGKNEYRVKISNLMIGNGNDSHLVGSYSVPGILPKYMIQALPH